MKFTWKKRNFWKNMVVRARLWYHTWVLGLFLPLKEMWNDKTNYFTSLNLSFQICERNIYFFVLFSIYLLIKSMLSAQHCSRCGGYRRHQTSLIVFSHGITSYWKEREKQNKIKTKSLTNKYDNIRWQDNKVDKQMIKLKLIWART